MQHRDFDPRDSYCAHCLGPAEEQARMCGTCRAPFVGSGAFDVIRGPRPSALFAELFSFTPALQAIR